MYIVEILMEVKETIQFYIVFNRLTPAVEFSKTNEKHCMIQQERS